MNEEINLTEFLGSPAWLNAKLWQKYGKRRIYIDFHYFTEHNNHKVAALGYIDLDNDDQLIITERSVSSKVIKLLKEHVNYIVHVLTMQK